jgi:membrane associated rhomboid family serine protease
MFLPYGDTPNPVTATYVNWLLIGINVTVFLIVTVPLMVSQVDLSDPLLLDYLRSYGARGLVSQQEILQNISAYDLFVFRYGFRPAAPTLSTLMSCMFLHGSWMHLAGNMLFLYIFGNNVEARLGSLPYLLVYLVTGVVATLFFAVFAPGSQIPLVGASGAISGVLGCYFLWFPRNRVKTFLFLFPFLMTTVMLPARLVLGVYLIIDNLLPFIVNGGVGSGVAYGAHIGGFLGGLGLAYGFDRWQGLRRLKI